VGGGGGGWDGKNKAFWDEPTGRLMSGGGSQNKKTQNLTKESEKGEEGV